MKLYIAAMFSANLHTTGNLFARLTDVEKQAHQSVRYHLESYHYIHKQSFVDKIKEDGVKVFLDSGAFSAFTQGVKIDLPAYCDYIKRNEDIIEKDGNSLLASVLDGIGDPLLTWQNQQYMEQLGVRPLPCFHYGEDERYLEWYMSKYEYITIGGMVPVDKGVLVHWLDRIWDKHLTDGSGRPKIKVHGFGLTTYNLMQRYPWYSVDSSSWVQQAANGNVVLTEYRPDSVIYLPVSNNSPTRRDEGRHINNMTEIERQALWQYIEKSGFDVERMKEVYLARWIYNCMSYDRLGTVLTDHTKSFKAPQPELF